MHLQDPESVLVLAEEGAVLARHTSAKKYVALFHELAGSALALQEQWPEAQTALAAAIRVADAIECRPVGWHARIRLAHILRELGDAAQADAYVTEVKVIVEVIADELTDKRLRSTFLSLDSISRLA